MSKLELWENIKAPFGIYKIKPNARKYSHVANNEFEFCNLLARI